MEKNNDFLNLLTSDYYKVSKLKSIFIALGIMFLFILITFASILALQKVSGVEDATGKDFLFDSLSSANIGLFIAIITGLFVGKEFSDGMMRLTIARGAKRVQVYFSKLLVIFTLVLAYAIIMLIVAGIFTAIIGYGTPFNGAEFGLIMRMFALEFLALLSSASIFTMFAFLFRSSGSTIGASIGFYLLISIISSVLLATGLAYATSDPDKANRIMDAAYFLPYQQSSIAASYSTPTTTQLVAAILMPFVYIAISTIVGVITFVKRDIK